MANTIIGLGMTRTPPDTGDLNAVINLDSDMSVTAYHVAKEKGTEICPIPQPQKEMLPEHLQSQLVGFTTLPFIIGGELFKHRFIVHKSVPGDKLNPLMIDVIFGNDFVTQVNDELSHEGYRFDFCQFFKRELFLTHKSCATTPFALKGEPPPFYSRRYGLGVVRK